MTNEPRNDTDAIRSLVRSGNKIEALRTLRADGSTLAEAQAALASLLTADDVATFEAAIAARPADAWVETAPGILEPASQLKAEG